MSILPCYISAFPTGMLAIGSLLILFSLFTHLHNLVFLPSSKIIFLLFPSPVLPTRQRSYLFASDYYPFVHKGSSTPRNIDYTRIHRVFIIFSNTIFYELYNNIYCSIPISHPIKICFIYLEANFFKTAIFYSIKSPVNKLYQYFLKN